MPSLGGGPARSASAPSAYCAIGIGILTCCILRCYRPGPAPLPGPHQIWAGSVQVLLVGGNWGATKDAAEAVLRVAARRGAVIKPREL